MVSELAEFIERHTGIITKEDSIWLFNETELEALIAACRRQIELDLEKDSE